MDRRRRSWIAFAGIATMIVAGALAATGPGQRLAGDAEVIWVGRAAFVAALAAVLGGVIAFGGFAQRGAGLSLVAGTVLVGTGFTYEGLATVVGATSTFAMGEPPAISDLMNWRGGKTS